MASVQGWRGSASFAGTIFTVYRWGLNWRADTFDVTAMARPTAALAGSGIYRGGIMDADITIDMFHETAEDPFNPGLATSPVPGVILAVRLDLDAQNVVATLAFSFPNVLVISAREDTSVRDVTRISVMGKVSVPRTVGISRANSFLDPITHLAP